MLRHRSAGTWLRLMAGSPLVRISCCTRFRPHHHPLPLRSGPLPIFLSTSNTGRTVSLPAGYTDWRVIDNDGCSRSTIPHRWARLMDRTSLRQEVPLHLQLVDPWYRRPVSAASLPGFWS